ncbi:MAG: mechanosensitive ion channel family protein [Puniceicoccaceae bacterium]
MEDVFENTLETTTESVETAASAVETAADAVDTAAGAVETAAEAAAPTPEVIDPTKEITDLVEQVSAIDWNAVGMQALSFGIKIGIALLIFFIGKFIAKRIEKIIKAGMAKKAVDPLLANFVSSIVFYLLMALVAITALGQAGVPVTSFVAIVGAAGLAVGLALQGSLANFASGVLIILFRPFNEGDFITAGGESGIVEAVTIFTTELKSPDGKKIIVPNGSIMSGSITNVTAHPIRRVDMTFGIGYTDDIDLARKLISEILEQDERILADPAPAIALAELAESSVNLVVRPWVEKANWWPVFTETQEKVKKAFDANGISIPFPQRDIHLYENKPIG